jgi:hypothetical protein
MTLESYVIYKGISILFISMKTINDYYYNIEMVCHAKLDCWYLIYHRMNFKNNNIIILL